MGKDKFSNNDSKESKNDLWRTLLITGGVVFAFWLLSWILIDLCISECDNRGTFGDKFGAVNALFSGLAFAGLIVTLLYQKEELKLQREELKETRNELNAQKLEFQEQNKVYDPSVKSSKYVYLGGVARQHPNDHVITAEEGYEMANLNANLNPTIVLTYDTPADTRTLIQMMELYVMGLPKEFIRTKEEIAALETKKYIG